METPQEREEVLLIRRKHILVFAIELLGPVLIALLPFVIYVLIAGREMTIGEQTILLELRPALVVFAASIWVLLWWMRIIGIWTNYFLDTWVVTNKRIVDRNQIGFFDRQTSMFRLDRIQDITIETAGIIPTLFHFGNIHVQTAGETRKFIMRGISNPKYVREVILRAQDHATEGVPVQLDNTIHTD